MNRLSIIFGVLFFIFTLSSQEIADKAKIKLYTLKECVDYALKNSPDLKKLELFYDNAKYNTLIEKAVFDLGLSLSSSRSEEFKENIHSTTLSQEIPGGFRLSSTGRIITDETANAQQSDLSVTLSKILLGGGTLEESLKGIRDGLVDELIALNNIGFEKRNIRFKVERQFYRIIRNMQGLEIQKRRLETAKNNLDFAKAKDKPIDIANAEIEIPENELNIIRATRQLASELDILKVIMGIPPDNELAINDLFEYKTMALKVDDDLFFAEKNEENFVNNALRKEKAERAIRVAAKRTEVDLSLNVTHEVASSNTKNADLRGTDDQIISLNLSFDLGERADKARLAKSKNELEENLVDRYILRQSKMKDLRDLERNIDETAKAVVLQEQSIKLSEKLVTLYKDRYDIGEIDILEYIRSQNNLEDNKVRMINLKTTYMELLSEYLFEVGR